MNSIKYTFFLFFQLPSAFFCGVRLKYLDSLKSIVSINHSWFNKNPFKSIFWAAQGMAAELTTGSLIKNAIKESGVNVSYLVVENKSSFYKKATGKIIFECNQGKELQDLFNSFDKDNNKAIIELKSIGVDSNNVKVSEFSFTWSLKVRS
ncbi:MAG: thioesterase [Flavobacteriaceae bacterium]|nr:thioesterase [Flavobacteriaceae bacterium]